MLQFRRGVVVRGMPDASPGVGEVAGLARLAVRSLAMERGDLGRQNVARIADVHFRQFVGLQRVLAGRNPKISRNAGDGFVIEGLDNQFARCHRNVVILGARP